MTAEFFTIRLNLILHLINNHDLISQQTHRADAEMLQRRQWPQRHGGCRKEEVGENLAGETTAASGDRARHVLAIQNHTESQNH